MKLTRFVSLQNRFGLPNEYVSILTVRRMSQMIELLVDVWNVDVASASWGM